MESRHWFYLRQRFPRGALAVFILCSGCPATAKYSFDSSLMDIPGEVDLSLFEQGLQPPGVYTADIFLNGEAIDSRDLNFRIVNDSEGKANLRACFSRDMLINYGIKVEDYPDLFSSKSNAQKAGENNEEKLQRCADLSAIPQTSENFIFNSQRLELIVPSIALQTKVTGIAPEVLWDDGIPALLMNYHVMVNRNEIKNNENTASSTSLYAQFEPGVNIGAWRLRNAMTWQKQDNQPGTWQNIYTYTERGINSWKSRLTFGEIYTSSDIFERIPFSGGLLATDESMLPSSLRSFSPTVRGIARSQARVEVSQNGYTVYSTVVSPGPFELNDLIASSAGDLQVAVHETDGTVQYFVVPYSVPAIALRRGHSKYSLATGWYRSASDSVDKIPVGQATLMYGLPWDLTIYGGLQWSTHYQATATGMGTTLGSLGTLSADSILSRGQKQGQYAEQGYSWRVRYNKKIETTNTGFSLTGNQFSESGFSAMSTVLDTYQNKDTNRSTDSEVIRGEKIKSSLIVSLNQPLASLGGISISGQRNTYWNSTQAQRSFMLSFNTSINRILLSVNWSRNLLQKNNDQTSSLKAEQQLSLRASIPISQSLDMSYQTQSGTNSPSSHEINLNGRNADHRLRWNASENILTGGQNGGRSRVNFTWTADHNELTGGYSYSDTFRQMNAGMAGGVLIHQHGLTLGQRLGETTGLVATPGVQGVSVGNWPGVKTDFNGYTTLSYMNPYKENIVSLDPSTLPANAEIPKTDMKVIPTTGAVVPVTFNTRVGARGVMRVTRIDGSHVPFGTVVTSDKSMVPGEGAGIADEEGNVFLTGLQNKGRLQARWGKNKDQQCYIDYRLPEKGGPFYVFDGMCRPLSVEFIQ